MSRKADPNQDVGERRAEAGQGDSKVWERDDISNRKGRTALLRKEK